MLDYVIRNGEKTPLTDLSVDAMSRDTIFHGLSNLNRFTGMRFPNCDEPFTVLEHSIAMAEVIFDITGNPELARMGLWHDAAEAFIGDIATPVKYMLSNDIIELEEKIEKQIFTHNKINIDPEQRLKIKHYDLTCCVAEILYMHGVQAATTAQVNVVCDDWLGGNRFGCDVYITNVFINKLNSLYKKRYGFTIGARKSSRHKAIWLDDQLLKMIDNSPVLSTYTFDGNTFRVTVEKTSNKIVNIELMG